MLEKFFEINHNFNFRFGDSYVAVPLYTYYHVYKGRRHSHGTYVLDNKIVYMFNLHWFFIYSIFYVILKQILKVEAHTISLVPPSFSNPLSKKAAFYSFWTRSYPFRHCIRIILYHYFMSTASVVVHFSFRVCRISAILLLQLDTRKMFKSIHK